jgi:hypothetical protein
MSTDFRIRSTHVGSLVRPDELIAYMHAIDAGEAYDQRAYEECLTREAGGFGRRRADRLGAPGARPRIVSGKSRNLSVAWSIVAAICPKSTTSPRGGRPFGRQRTWHRCW